MEEKETFPFVIKVETIAGKSVKETCYAAVSQQQLIASREKAKMKEMKSAA
jgi:hypothetical protein